MHIASKDAIYKLYIFCTKQKKVYRKGFRLLRTYHTLSKALSLPACMGNAVQFSVSKHARGSRKGAHYAVAVIRTQAARQFPVASALGRASDGVHHLLQYPADCSGRPRCGWSVLRGVRHRIGPAVSRACAFSTAQTVGAAYPRPYALHPRTHAHCLPLDSSPGRQLPTPSVRNC